MGTCVVAVEQQTVGTVAWTMCRPSFEDLGQANVDAPLAVAGLPLLERGRGCMTEFGEDRDYFFGSASRFLEFPKWALTWKKPD